MNKNANQDKEQAPPKPKIQFTMKFDLWDDGEITRDLSEKVQGERGAPKKWQLEARDFGTSVKANFGDKTKIFEQILASLDITVEEMKKSYSLDKPTQAKMEKIANAFASCSSTEPAKDEFIFDKE